MAPTQEQFDLISHIYDAALDETAWVSILDGIAAQCCAHGSAIALADPHSPEVHIQRGSSVYSSDMLAEYDRRFHGEDLEAYQSLLRHPAHRMFCDTELLYGEVPARDRPAQQFLYERLGIEYRAAARLNKDGAWVSVMTLQHHKDHGPMTRAEAEIAALFLPHLAKSVELTRPFMILKARFQAVMAALDRFHVGIFILAAPGHVVLRNREAERILSLHDGLSQDRTGHLAPTNESDRIALRQAVLKAAATARAEDARAETLLVLPRRSEGDPFLVEVAPLRESNGELDREFSGAMVFVIDPMRTDMVSIEGMQALYNLTPAESETGRLIVDGLGTDEVAETRRVSRETVRTHVKQLLEKTGTRNRAQFVRLALNVNLPIDKPESSSKEN